jgi:hypothetical protein
MKVYEFQKNALEKVIIQFTEYRGKKLIDLRVYYNAGQNNMEDWKPTPKGISLSRELIKELKKGIEEAYKQWMR